MKSTQGDAENSPPAAQRTGRAGDGIIAASITHRRKSLLNCAGG
jgi:hypothetical protein